MPSLPHLEIVGRLAPAILIDDIGEGNTADWPEPAYGVADRQQGVGMHVRRQPECGLHFLLEVQIKRRQCRTETERSRRQKHVLHCWIDR